MDEATMDRRDVESFCRAGRTDPRGGTNAIALLEIDDYQKTRARLGLDGVERLMRALLEALSAGAEADTRVARWGDMTVAALLRLPDPAALPGRCRALHRRAGSVCFGAARCTVSLGAAPCADDRGALERAFGALGQAQAAGNRVVVCDDADAGRKTGVLLVESQPLSARHFENVIRSSDRYELVGCVRSADDAGSHCMQGRVALVLMDALTAMDGLAAARIKAEWPDIRVVIVTSVPEAGWPDKARASGVDSFWYKELRREPLLEIMDRTMAGESVYPERTPRVQLGHASSYDLSRRELAVLRGLTGGATNAQIAKALGVAPSTVKTYVERLMDKTGFRSRTELAVRARASGLIIGE